MITILPMVAVLLLQWISGLGIIGLLGSSMSRAVAMPIGLLLGMFVHSLLFFACDLVGIPLSLGSTIVTAVLCALIPLIRFSKVSAYLVSLTKAPTWTLAMYDVIALGVLLYVGYIVVWAAYYWPVTPFDALAGIDLVARQTAVEGTIVNRVFSDPSLAGHLSNQPFYAPFAMLLQTMYRLIGFPYGQIWVSIVAILFTWFVWTSLREVAHRFIAAVLWLLYALTPEMLGYTYLVQTDYLNAAFFASGVLLLFQGIRKKETSYAWIASILLLGACWSRTESIVLVGLGVMCSSAFMINSYGRQFTLRWTAVTLAASTVVFGLWHWLFFSWYLPVQPDTQSQLIGWSWERFANVVTSTYSNVVADINLWGVAFLLLAIGIIISLAIARSVKPTFLLVWMAVVFVGLFIVTTVLSTSIVEQTVRRGVFKVIPLIFVYIAGSEIMMRISHRLNKWEAGQAS